MRRHWPTSLRICSLKSSQRERSGLAPISVSVLVVSKMASRGTWVLVHSLLKGKKQKHFVHRHPTADQHLQDPIISPRDDEWTMGAYSDSLQREPPQMAAHPMIPDHLLPAVRSTLGTRPRRPAEPCLSVTQVRGHLKPSKRNININFPSPPSSARAASPASTALMHCKNMKIGISPRISTMRNVSNQHSPRSNLRRVLRYETAKHHQNAGEEEDAAGEEEVGSWSKARVGFSLVDLEGDSETSCGNKATKRDSFA